MSIVKGLPYTLAHPSDTFIGKGWLPYDNAVPNFVLEYLPAKPKLGKHVVRTSSLDNGAILIVCFDNSSRIPLKWAVLPNPHKELPL